MARNRNLSLEYVGYGRWKTMDGRFMILRQAVPINPMEITSNWKIATEYSIRDFREYDGPADFPQLAPQVGVVGTYGEVYPWLGKFTGEGSFELGNPNRIRAKVPGPIKESVLRERRYVKLEGDGLFIRMLRG